MAGCGKRLKVAQVGCDVRRLCCKGVEGIHDMRPYAVELVAFVNGATKKEGSKKRSTQMYAHQTVSGLAAS